MNLIRVINVATFTNKSGRSDFNFFLVETKATSILI
jgi:hypothetical protein